MKTGWKTLMVAGGAILGLSSLLLAGGGGGPAFGRGPAHEPGMGMGMMSHGGGPMGPGGVLGPAAAQLNLTDEQKQAIRTICQQSRADSNEVVGAIDEARAALHEAVIGGANEEHIRAAAAALGTAIGNQAVLQAKTVAAARAVLTEEQRKEHQEVQATVPHSRQGMSGRGFGGGPLGGRMGLQAHGPNGPNGTGQAPVHSAAPGGPAPMPHMALEQMFKTADINKDGVLSMDEMKAFQDARRGGPGMERRQ